MKCVCKESMCFSGNAPSNAACIYFANSELQFSYPNPSNSGCSCVSMLSTEVKELVKYLYLEMFLHYHNLQLILQIEVTAPWRLALSTNKHFCVFYAYKKELFSTSIDFDTFTSTPAGH